jgi:hypothetical protein
VEKAEEEERKALGMSTAEEGRRTTHITLKVFLLPQYLPHTKLT